MTSRVFCCKDCALGMLLNLHILSVITLPLGIIAGLLGMNVGGVPGRTNPNAFAAVVISMIIHTAVELWFFKRGGWFD
jgi:zinc transporter